MLSVIIPVLDEAESLPQLHRELARVAIEEGYDLQIIIVDDGSTDGSWAVIEQLAAQDSRVLGIRFRRNFGKAAALSAGFNAAEGDRIVMLDADLQDDPAEIPHLFAKLDEGFDVVSGWKRVRNDPWTKVLQSRVFNSVVSWLTGVQLHDHNCGLKCLRREVVHEIRLYGGLHRFLPVLAAGRGFRVGEVVVHHRARQFGRSKYGVSRIVSSLLDLLTVTIVIGHGQRPQHLLGGIGLGSCLLGTLGLLYLALRSCFTSALAGDAINYSHETFLLCSSLAVLAMGVQFMLFGFLSESMTAYLVRERDSYSLAEHTAPLRIPRPTITGTASDTP